MTNTLDGFDFDMPPTVSQIVALAQYHRTLLDEAVFHQEIHLGDFVWHNVNEFKISHVSLMKINGLIFMKHTMGS